MNNKWKDELRNVKDPSGIFFLRELGQNEIVSIERFISNAIKAETEELDSIIKQIEDILDEKNEEIEDYKEVLAQIKQLS